MIQSRGRVQISPVVPLMPFVVKETHFLIWDPILHLLVIPLSFHREQFRSLLFYLFWMGGVNYGLYIFSGAEALYVVEYLSFCICLFSRDCVEALLTVECKTVYREGFVLL